MLSVTAADPDDQTAPGISAYVPVGAAATMRLANDGLDPVLRRRRESKRAL